MNRRAFIQGLIGLATMPMLSKYINVFKPAAVREGITQAADNTMSKGIEFYEAVIKRVMDEGKIIGESDRVRTYKHPDKPDINVELNVGTGDTAVYFETDMGSRAGAEISTDIEIPRAGKELMEHEEVYRMGQGDDYYKDIDEEITGGVGSLEEWIKMKRGYAAGGRVGMWKGGMPRGLMAALRAIRSKFGDDAITTADRAPQPAKTTQEEIMDFNARNPNPNKQMTDEIEELEELKRVREMAPQMVERLELKARYPGITDDLLDSILIDDNPQRKAEVLATLDEAFAMMRKGKGPDEVLRIIKDMKRTKQADGGSIDGDVSLTVIKIPDISQSGVESLFKRR